jgi:hypothetical protein
VVTWLDLAIVDLVAVGGHVGLGSGLGYSGLGRGRGRGGCRWSRGWTWL